MAYLVKLPLISFLNFTSLVTPLAPDTRVGGGAPEMESRLSTLATCGFEVRTSLEATTG